MKQAGKIFLMFTTVCWGTIIGGILYSHIAYFPVYLSHLPESATLTAGPYPIREDRFWMLIHPITILSVIVTLLVNWKLRERRKYILMVMGIYAVAIITTFIYFVPELMAFSNASQTTSISAPEWYERGQKWQHLSWIRGAFMYLGFILLLISLTKNNNDHKAYG